MNKKLDFLIIDDSEVNNYYTEDLLEEFDFTNSITTFLKPQEALDDIVQKVKNGERVADVIFLDIRMPEMDGFEFIEELDYQLEEETLDSKIFILTSSKHRRDVEAFEKQLTASEFLSKPLEKEELLEMLNKHFK